MYDTQILFKIHNNTVYTWANNYNKYEYNIYCMHLKQNI